MKKSDLKNIILSFEMPKESNLKEYEFLKEYSVEQGGGLSDQVVTTYKELSLEDIYEEVISLISEDIPSEIEEIVFSIVGAVISIAWSSTSISLFPDEYKEMIDLVDKTEEGNSLNLNQLNQLIEDNEEIVNILDELVKQEFLRKKKNGQYIVLKNILTNTHISFLQIAK